MRRSSILAFAVLSLLLAGCNPTPGNSQTNGSSSSSVAKAMCGGIAALPCPNGLVCIDNPDDSCDPAHGGADCGGICVPSSERPSGHY